MPNGDVQSPSGGGNPLIIVVDDDPFIVEGLGLVLEGWGFDVVTALSLEELSRKLPALTALPALVLADHFLPPRGTGADAVEMVRRHAGTAVPAIILTGDTTPERQSEAAANRFRLLHKPVLPGPLQAAVNETIGGA